MRPRGTRRLAAGNHRLPQVPRRRCGSTTRRASWCARAAGWPTRSATTSRCCSWTRHGGLTPRRPRRSWRHGVNTPHGGGLSLAALRLDDPEMVEAGDPGGMLRQVASSAAQVRTALRACAEADLSALRPDTRPRAIVVAGSGGSAFAGDALAAICGVSSPVQVLRVSGYQLPGWVGAADLVIAVSRSGQTAEPVALATEATRRGCELGRGRRARLAAAGARRSAPGARSSRWTPAGLPGPCRGR